MNRLRTGGQNNLSNATKGTFDSSPMGKVAAMRKMPVKVRQFGDYMFDYISSCKHNLKDDTYQSCPLCKLADQTTRKFFEREEIQRIKLREQSFINRALLRCNLIYQWSLCQSLHYHTSDLDPCFEIVWSSSLAETVCAYHELLTHISSSDVSFDDMFRMLERRNRIHEVGHFAAVFLQSRIRKFLTKCSVRRMLLRRFEMVPPTKRKEMYFYDQLKQRKWNHYPHLIGEEPPGTPRTIERRLAYEDRFREDHMKRYHDSLVALHQNNSQMRPETYIQREEKAISLFKHLLVLRDLVAVYMQRLMSDRIRTLSPPHKRGAALSTLPIDSNSLQASSSSVPIAVFVTTMSPALSARSLGVALALSSTPSPATILASAAVKQNRLNGNKGVNDNGKNAVGISSAAMYRALQILELNIWDSLVIKRADDILPIILCKELVGTYEGIMNIVQDEFGIWNANYNPPLIKDSTPALLANNNFHNEKNPLQGVMFQRQQQELDGFAPLPADDNNTAAANSVINRSSSKDPRDSNDDDFLPGEVLPFGLHLRPTAINMEDRPPSNFFRLFFFEQECIAISAVSPWVYYPEVNKNKESILASIRKFLASPKLRALVRDYYLSANQVNNPGPFQQQQARRNNRRRGGDGKHHNQHHNIQSFFTPPERTIFPPSEHVQMMQEPLTIFKLTDSQVTQLSGRYAFLQKSSEFQKKVEQVRKNEIQRVTRGGLSTASRDTANAGIPKTISLDLASLSIAEGEHEGIAINSAEVQEKLANAQEDFITAANTDNDDIVLRGSEAQRLLTYFLRSSASGGGGGSRQQKSRGKTSEKASQASRFEETPYVQLLYEHSVNVDTAIQPRIRHMPNETFPGAQLLVIDIQVTLPRSILPTHLQNLSGRRGGVTQSTALNVKLKATAAAAADDDTSSVETENSMMSMEVLRAAEKEEQQHANVKERYTSYMTLNIKDDFPINVHQVVGMFCCEKDRAPGNFDGGLFEFEYFRSIYREGVAVNTTQPTSNTTASTAESVDTSISVGGGMNIPPPAGSPPGTMNMYRELGRDRNGWVAPSPFSGVTNCKGVLPSGREFNFNILGANPSREYLEKVLPRKVKIWLGLPV